MCSAEQRLLQSPFAACPAYAVGMALLARLAVDQPQHGRGVGAMLLAEALRKAVAAGRSLPHASSW
jgi:predicted N-acetyltransferase YhbS